MFTRNFPEICGNFPEIAGTQKNDAPASKTGATGCGAFFRRVPTALSAATPCFVVAMSDEPQIINKIAPFGKLTMEIILEMVIYDDLWLSYGWNPIVTNNQKAHLLVI